MKITIKSLICLAVALSLLVFLRISEASPSAAYSPPSQITVWMYRLSGSGGIQPPPTLCSFGDASFGCTAFAGNSRYAYPYSTNPVTIPIETDYLLDVVPQEMGTYYHPVALQAQAIAARSSPTGTSTKGAPSTTLPNSRLSSPISLKACPQRLSLITPIIPAPAATSTPLNGLSAALLLRATTFPTALPPTMICLPSPNSPPMSGIAPLPEVNPISWQWMILLVRAAMPTPMATDEE